MLFSTRSLLQADAVGRLKSSAEHKKLHFSASVFCCTEKVNFSICLNEQSHYIKSALHLFNAASACSRIKLLPLSDQYSECARKPVLFMALLKKKKKDVTFLYPTARVALFLKYFNNYSCLSGVI